MTCRNSRGYSFEVETDLEELDKCIDAIQKALKFVGVTNKRSRNSDYNREARTAQFNRKILEIRRRLTKLIDHLTSLLTTDKLYDDIAKDILLNFHTTREKFNIDDDNYQLAIACIVKPTIEAIMNETEFSKSSRERQDRRKYFLRQLIDFRYEQQQSRAETGNEQQRRASSDSIEVDVCSISPRQDSDTTNSATSNEYPVLDYCTAEGIMVLNSLFDALTRHSTVVSKNDLDVEEQIYHIINITHIVDILRQYFKDVKMDKQSELESSVSMSILLEPIGKFEESISKNLELFDLETPMTLFRMDLRKLLIQLRVLGPILMQ